MHERAGTTALPEDLIDVDALIGAYYDRNPDPENPDQQVAFGTSGHRGSSLDSAFNEAHIIAITAAIVEYRRGQGTDGPLFLGRDTHALSLPAWQTALEVLAAAEVEVHVDARDGYTPTPAVSHAILLHNGAGTSEGVRTTGGAGSGLADGIVVTPSHNPPRDGGFKYNPPHGGPADSDATGWIADRANELMRSGLGAVRRTSLEKALAATTTRKHDFMSAYVADLPNVVDLELVRASGVRIGADPLGGASVDYWGEIAERHGLDLTVVNPKVDPRWAFMTLDWDGKIRMDCSSPYAMASLVNAMTGTGGTSPYDLATGNDADADRHGIVTPDAGLMNPNHYLATAISYLYGGGRPNWPADAAIGKTLVSSALIDKVAAHLDRRLLEVPVGLQVVRPRAPGRLGRLRRRGVRRRVLPPDGRLGLDHRQGRHPAGAARLRRSPRRPARRRRSCTRTSSSGTASPGTPGSTPRPRGSRRRPSARSGPSRSPRPSSPASRSPDVSSRPRATVPPSAASRSPPSTPGSPHAPRAPRTSTRSTPSRSSRPTTSAEVQQAARALVTETLGG